ncbi:glycoside hydrolase family 15 protein [Lysobacter korlensis]|uniref:Glycoside hydrolase family 15 protein n=1 Tax=Lysobacter korlensis TaxID=553636 RepID=A0ABV6RLU7_9GAMM
MTEIRDLALIGDRRTAAIVDRRGSVVWYCPRRFDQPSLLASLLDEAAGGSWSIEAADLQPQSRCYSGDSAILRTTLVAPAGALTVTDWMPLGEDLPAGICRRFTESPFPLTVRLAPAPDYARESVRLARTANGVCINGCQWLYASGTLAIDGQSVLLEVPPGQPSWMVLVDSPLDSVSGSDLDHWHGCTVASWRDISSRITYRGPFEPQVAQSLRALRLLTHRELGGVIAAATTSLPEVAGGDRNYDYRYVWMRDASMIVSALVRAGSNGPDEQRFLDFICSALHENEDKPLLPPFLSLDSGPAQGVSCLDLAGYQDSRPVRIGNDANDQLQLDGFANVLLAAKLIYGRHGTREHWETSRRVADFLVDNWHRPDYGVWEEHEPRQYTTAKVVASCGLRYIADFAEDESMADRWRQVSKEIERYVHSHCLTRDGAYAVYAGSDAVDVSAALFPTWGFCEPDSEAMLETIRLLESRYRRGHLYWRHLEELPRFREGAFLAGSIWVAQYWVLRGDLERARDILEEILGYANDLGYFAEEADPETGAMLGNFPQAFVHASFIGAVIDYRDALKQSGSGTAG